MASKRFTITMVVVGLTALAGCGDDGPASNTPEGPSTNTVRDTAPGTSTASTEGNVGDISGSTPVAADEDVVQGNQPMMSFAED